MPWSKDGRKTMLTQKECKTLSRILQTQLDETEHTAGLLIGLRGSVGGSHSYVVAHAVLSELCKHFVKMEYVDYSELCQRDVSHIAFNAAKRLRSPEQVLSLGGMILRWINLWSAHYAI